MDAVRHGITEDTLSDHTRKGQCAKFLIIYRWINVNFIPCCSSLLFNVYSVCICVSYTYMYAHVYTLTHTFILVGSRGQLSKSCFSPSTMWVSRTEFRLSDLVASSDGHLVSSHVLSLSFLIYRYEIPRFPGLQDATKCKTQLKCEGGGKRGCFERLDPSICHAGYRAMVYIPATLSFWGWGRTWSPLDAQSSRGAISTHWLPGLCVDVLPRFSTRLHPGSDLIIRYPDWIKGPFASGWWCYKRVDSHTACLFKGQRIVLII